MSILNADLPGKHMDADIIVAVADATQTDTTRPPTHQSAAWWYHSTGRECWNGGHMTAICREHPFANIRHTKDMMFDEYAGEECVIYANWDPHTPPYALKELKGWIDDPPTQTCSRPTTIIITSRYTIEQCCSHPKQRAQLNWMLSRFRVRAFPAPGDLIAPDPAADLPL